MDFEELLDPDWFAFVDALRVSLTFLGRTIF
jgi:hypothetical protein